MLIQYKPITAEEKLVKLAGALTWLVEILESSQMGILEEAQQAGLDTMLLICSRTADLLAVQSASSPAKLSNLASLDMMLIIYERMGGSQEESDKLRNSVSWEYDAETQMIGYAEI